MGSINGAIIWGTSVKVAFDLYRKKLWERLELNPVSSYRDEVIRWKEISNLILLGERYSDPFNYEDANKQQKEKGNENNKPT